MRVGVGETWSLAAVQSLLLMERKHCGTNPGASGTNETANDHTLEDINRLAVLDKITLPPF